MSIEPEQLRIVLRRWATGVTLVTSCQGPTRHGMTVNSFTGVSLDPALVLVSLEKTTRTHKMVSATGRFAVSILSLEQEELAQRFGGAVPDADDRFAGLAVEMTPQGLPIPRDCLAFLDCQIVGSHSAGTHTVFIAEVLECRVINGGEPLLYFNQDYRGLAL
ncbi:MAG TPA: flavin reductase family protein [Anaerolineales bacterium]|nr:flavin reductase family protein [Anaerolineales bacterium]